jgi:uncharacterized protein (DUF433 family)
MDPYSRSNRGNKTMTPCTEADIYYLYMENGWTISGLAKRYNLEIEDIQQIIHHYKLLEV